MFKKESMHEKYTNIQNPFIPDHCLRLCDLVGIKKEESLCDKCHNYVKYFTQALFIYCKTDNI